MIMFFKKNDGEIQELKLWQRVSSGSSVVGIDIGSMSVNVAQVARYRGRPTLVRTRIVDIKQGPDIDKDQATLKALHIALEDFNRRNIKYACVVNCPQTSVRKVITPYMPKEELLGAVSLEVKRSIPFPLESAVLDFNVIEEVFIKGVEKLSIIVAASPRKTVERILSFFTPKKVKPFAGTIRKKFEPEEKLPPIGIRISALLPLPLCLENIIERSKLKIEETLVTIEVGSVISELNIFKNSRLQFSRKIPFSGADITRSMTTGLMTEKGRVELSLQEAERIKREYGIPKTNDHEHIEGKMTATQLLSLIRPKVEQLANEIERSFDFYREEMRGSKVERIVLFGGGAQLKGLPEFLSDELGLEVNVGNPLADIEMITEDVVQREEDAHRLVLAIGAALSSLKGINLLPGEIKQKISRKIKKLVRNTAAAAIAGAFLLTFIPLKVRTGSLASKYEAYKNEQSLLQPALLNIKERMVIDGILNDHPYWDEALKEIGNVIPAQMHLRDLAMDKNALRIQGVITGDRTNAQRSLSKFMVDLEAGLFKKVRLLNTAVDMNSLDKVVFELSCEVE